MIYKVCDVLCQYPPHTVVFWKQSLFKKTSVKTIWKAGAVSFWVLLVDVVDLLASSEPLPFI